MPIFYVVYRPPKSKSAKLGPWKERRGTLVTFPSFLNTEIYRSAAKITVDIDIM